MFFMGIFEIVIITIVLAVIITALVFGVKAYSKRKIDHKIVHGSDGRTIPEIKKMIKEGHKKIGTIFRAAEDMDNDALRKKINDVCIAARNIYDNLEKYPHDIQHARRFLNYYIDTTVTIVSKYVELAKNRDIVPNVDETLLQVEKTMDALKQSFDKQYAKLLEDDLFDLDAEIRLLNKSIELE